MEKDCRRPAGDRGSRREMAARPQGGQGGNKQGELTGDVLYKERPAICSLDVWRWERDNDSRMIFL